MQNHNRLAVYGRAIELALAVYRLTERFPSNEQFGLTIQMRRAVVSIGSNIAEGCGRWSRRELLQFLQIAYSSAAELGFQMHIATQLDYGDASDRAAVAELVDHVQRMLNRLMQAKRTALTHLREGRPSPQRVSHEV